MDREQFLGALALRLGRPRSRAAPPRPAPNTPTSRPPADLSAQFVAELEAVGGRVTRARSLAELGALLEAELRAAAGPAVAYARSEFADLELPFAGAGQGGDRVDFWGEGVLADPHVFRQRALAADLGLTTVDAAVAASGSLLLSAGPTRPRAVSLLPRKHLALVRQSQLVADLASALSRAPAEASSFYFVTGPSRTSDIENDLSIGVHGPAEVHVVLLCEGSA